MNETIKTLEEFIAWTEKLDGRMLLYRGLADADWRVESSALRRLRVSSEAPPPIAFQNYTKQLLDNASLQGFRYQRDREMSDLELLAELQHYGAATCLIDFTENSLIALWFACREELKKDAKVVAMPTEDPDKFRTVTYEHSKRPILQFLNKGNLWQWTPSSLNNRIVAQLSVFVFGEGAIQENLYDEIGIEAEAKPSIKATLERSFGLNEQRVFIDLSGFALNNAHDRPYNNYTAEDFFYWGLNYHQQGQLKNAIEYYGKAIVLDPRSVVSYDNRGSAKSALGDHKAAISDFDRAIEIYPQSADAFYNRGNSKRALGQHKGAIADYDRAIEINPKFADAYVNRGSVKGQMGDHNGAIADCDKALEIYPQLEVAFDNRGSAKLELGHYQGAIADYDKALEINPLSPSTYYNRGNVKRTMGDYQGAILDYDRSLEIEPRSVAAYNNRGIAKKALGDLAGADADIERAREIQQNRQPPKP